MVLNLGIFAVKVNPVILDSVRCHSAPSQPEWHWRAIRLLFFFQDLKF